MPRRLVAVVFALLLAFPAAADDPAFNGRPMSDWLTMLREDSLPRKRRAAVVALGQIAADSRENRERVLTALARALRQDANPAVRAQIATTLGQQPSDLHPLFLSDLAEVLRIEKDSAARREIAVALGRLGKSARPALVPLTDALKDPVPATRAAAAEALGRIGLDARPSAPAVLPLMADPDRTVRRAAAFALGRLDPEDPAPASAALVAAVQAEQKRDGQLAAACGAASSAYWPGRRDEEMTLELVVAMGLLGDRSAEVVQAVAGRLTDPSPEVRRQAGLSLGKFGPAARNVAAPLTAVFRADPDRLARTYALHTLCTAYGSDAADLIPVMTERLAKDPDFEVRVAIAEELGALGRAGSPAVTALREAQKDPQVKVREAAVAAVKLIQRPVPEKKP